MVVAPPFWGPNLREVFCFLLVSIGKVLGPSWRKKKGISPSFNRKYIFIQLHSWHSCFILPGSYARFTRVYMTCIPFKCGGLFLYFPLDPKTPRHPQFGYIGQYPAFRLGVLECPLRHVLAGHIHLSGKLTWKKPPFLWGDASSNGGNFPLLMFSWFPECTFWSNDFPTEFITSFLGPRAR